MAKRISKMLILLLVLVCNGVYADEFKGIEFQRISGVNADDDTGYGGVGYTYWISQQEVSYTQYSQATGITGGSLSEDHWVGSLGTNAPAVNVSWNEAAQFCNWMSSGDATLGVYTISGSGGVTAIDRTYRNGEGIAFVIPTEDEWYKAAYYNGSGYNTYANLTDTLPGLGTEANYGVPSGGSAWAINGVVEELNGTYNMMGNVWEPTEDTFSGDPLASDPNMMFRGGSYAFSSAFLEADTRNDPLNKGARNVELIQVGLRLAVIPEPGTMSLMGLSTVGLFFTRTMRRRKRLGQTLMPVRRDHSCDMFDLERDWNAGPKAEGDDSLTVLLSELKDGCVKLWSDIFRVQQSIDKAFWNRMVVLHERRVARRTRLRKTLRKKALDGFDAFLVLIMK